MEPVVPVPAAPNPALVADGAAAAPAEGGNGDGAIVGVEAIDNPAVPVAGVAAPPAPVPAVVVPAAPGALPIAQPRAPMNAVQYLNQLCRDGFTIPTGPGIFLDVVSFFMGLIFSIVPSWAPYRLHR